MTARVAAFVDGENICADHAERIRRIAARRGSPDILRVYGNAGQLPKWQKASGFRLIHSGTGKNATDLLLAIGAMEFALSGQFATAVVASSDRDFTHLATRLRERGLTVVGAGMPQTSDMFRAACSVFETLDAAPPCAATASDLDHKIRKVIGANSKNGHGMPIGNLGAKTWTKHGIRISTRPQGTWRQYLAKRQELFAFDPRGPDAHVRFRPAGFAAE